jgi:hypothetical protein
MTDNLLTSRLAASRPATRDLDQFVAEANRNFWVQDSGRPYFVNERPGADGVMIRFMDRNG